MQTLPVHVVNVQLIALQIGGEAYNEQNKDICPSNVSAVSCSLSVLYRI